MFSLLAPVPEPFGGTPNGATGTVALVRLRGRGDRAVKVRLCAVMNRAVSNRNCVGAIRGGEQRNENDAVNSIRSVWMGESASERRSLSGRE